MSEEKRGPSPACDKCGINPAAVSYVTALGGSRDLCRDCDGQEKQEVTAADVGKVEDILGDFGG